MRIPSRPVLLIMLRPIIVPRKVIVSVPRLLRVMLLVRLVLAFVRFLLLVRRFLALAPSAFLCPIVLRLLSLRLPATVVLAVLSRIILVIRRVRSSVLLRSVKKTVVLAYLPGYKGYSWAVSSPTRPVRKEGSARLIR